MTKTYEEIYKSKRITLEEALSMIKSNSEVAVSCCALEPSSMLSSLHKLRDRVENVNVLHSVPYGMHQYMTEPENYKAMKTTSFFFGEPIRMAHKNKGATYQPCNLHDLARRRLDYKKPYIFIGSATAMDNHGFVRSSLSLLYEKEFMEAADIVIMEINPNLPMVNGETEIHIRDIDYIIEVDNPVPVLGRSQITEVEKSIGEYVASLVNDGDTIQLGIGAIPDAAALAFLSKHDLGVHTEMITSSIADLVEAEVITNRKKTLHNGKIVGAFAFGDEKLYKMLDNNPSIAILKASYVNDPTVIARNDNMVSINTGVQVDLTGQVCSESMGSRQYSGSGGQMDTAFGATHSKGGKSILALKSTAKGGSLSTIVPILSPGSVVTLSRNIVDYVITEYGVAPLRGRSITERVNNLIAIAHPDFRSELKKEAERICMW